MFQHCPLQVCYHVMPHLGFREQNEPRSKLKEEPVVQVSDLTSSNVRWLTGADKLPEL